MNGCTNNNRNVISACMNERTLLAKRKSETYFNTVPKKNIKLLNQFRIDCVPALGKPQKMIVVK